MAITDAFIERKILIQCATTKTDRLLVVNEAEGERAHPNFGARAQTASDGLNVRRVVPSVCQVASCTGTSICRGDND
jgi:hypothetical protein